MPNSKNFTSETLTEAKSLLRIFRQYTAEQEIRGEQPWLKQDVAEMLDVTPGYISNLMSGENVIPLDRALQFGHIFGTTIDKFSTRLAQELENAADAIPQSTFRVTKDVRVFNGTYTEVKDFIQLLKRGKKVPIENDTEMMHWSGPHSSATYSLPVNDERMAPSMPAGSKAIVDLEQEAQINKDVALIHGGKFMYARFKGEGDFELTNKDYEDRFFKLNQRSVIIGRVIGKIVYD